MQGGVDRGVVKVDRLRDEHEQQPDNEHEHVEEEQPASKVEQTSNTRPKRTYTHKQTHTHIHIHAQVLPHTPFLSCDLPRVASRPDHPQRGLQLSGPGARFTKKS